MSITHCYKWIYQNFNQAGAFALCNTPRVVRGLRNRIILFDQLLTDLAHKMHIDAYPQQTGLRPPAMIATLKTLYNALSFANVSTLGELRTKLRTVDAPAAQPARPVHDRAEAPVIARIYPAA